MPRDEHPWRIKSVRFPPIIGRIAVLLRLSVRGITTSGSCRRIARAALMSVRDLQYRVNNHVSHCDLVLIGEAASQQLHTRHALDVLTQCAEALSSLSVLFTQGSVRWHC